ncbi:sodium/proline symporter [soil metagenome]|nr:sodium/proline symporter [Acidobacteriota bacterium]
MIFAFVLYLLGIAALTAFSMRGMTSSSEFLLGGRTIGPLGTAISAAASARSASAMIGQAGLAFMMGFQALWIVFAYTLLEYMAMLFLMGPRIRRFSSRRDAITIPEYLEARFIDSRNLLRAVCAVLLVVFMVAYVVSQYVGMSFTITQVLGLPLVPSIVLAAVLTGAYTMLGGYRAIVYTDVMQGCLMLIAMVVVPILAWQSVGGLGQVVDRLHELGGQDLSGIIGGGGYAFAFGMLFAGLGAFGNPHIIVRYMAIRSVRDFRIAAFVNLLFNIIISWGGIMLGLAGRVLYQDVQQLPLANAETIFFHVSRSMIPTDFLVGILWAGVFAAMMSSADSMILVVTSSISRDLYQKVLKRGEAIAEATMVRLNKWIVVLTVLVSLVLTFFMEKSALAIALFAWGGLGGALGPVVLLSLWWRRMTKWGALAGLIGGLTMAVVWRSSEFLRGVLVYEALPAFLFSVVMIVGVSLLTLPPSDPTLADDLRPLAGEEEDIQPQVV